VIVDEMTQVAAANPGRERLVGLAMTALHRCGRTAEALRYFERSRRWLADELGVDPSTELRELHQSMLDGDPAAGPPRADAAGEREQFQEAAISSWPGGPGSTGFVPAVPHLLPAVTADFSEREIEIDRTRALLVAESSAVRLAVVTGPAGVGKTALSVHVAHQLLDHFPDGQLYADLHGHDRRAAPSAEEVLAWFLRALGVSDMPDAVDERAALYRNLLAGRKVLVVLDNAHDADQVRTLIPGAPTCAVLITSRTRLGTAIGAASTELDVFEESAALRLLSRIADRTRIAHEPNAAAEIVRLCGGLPLALRIVAARLNAKPHWSLGQLQTRLADERKRLDHLAYGDLDVRASILLSYTDLSSAAKRLLRRLGDAGMTDVDLWSSAALLNTNTGDAEEVLEELHDSQLLDANGTSSVGGYHRYRLHDLVRLVAAEQAGAEEPAKELFAARERLYGTWLHLVETAYGAVYGAGSENITSPASRHTVDHDLVTSVAADPVSWVDAERRTITTLIRRAAGHGAGAACWGMACTAFSLLEMGRHFDDCNDTLTTAHDHLTSVGDDPLGLAAIRYRLGSHHANRNDDDRALTLYQQAADMFDELNHQHGHAMATLYVGLMHRRLGRSDEAMDSLLTALNSLAGTDDGGQAFALRNIAQLDTSAGNHASAHERLDQALDLARRGRSRRREAQILFHQSMLCLEEHRHQEADRLFVEVLGLVQAIHDRPGEIQALRGIALCHNAAGRTELARTTLLEALRLAAHPTPTLMETRIRNELSRLPPDTG
jgi:tetratricopeptide (TPR) repeat protein